MFTGIVTAMGRVTSYKAVGGGGRMRILVNGGWLDNTVVGDSMAVDGACLTVVRIEEDSFEADVSPETAAICKHWRAGDRVNLEAALPMGGKMGGHFVSGHVEDSVRVLRVEHKDEGRRLLVAMPSFAAPYILNKGSVTLDGVSLTITGVYRGLSDIRAAAAQTAQKAEVVREHEEKLHDMSKKLRATSNNRTLLDMLSTAKDAAQMAGVAMRAANLASDVATMAADTASSAMDTAADVVVNDAPANEALATPYFSVYIVPHTLTNTTLSRISANDYLHIETDILARYAHHRDDSQIRFFVDMEASANQSAEASDKSANASDASADKSEKRHEGLDELPLTSNGQSVT